MAEEKTQPTEEHVEEEKVETKEAVETAEESSETAETKEEPTEEKKTEDVTPVTAEAEEKPSEIPPEPLFKAYDEDDEELPEEVIVDIDDLEDEGEYSLIEMNAWQERYAETMKEFKSNELVMGKVVAINDSDVAVDIGFKSEGSIPVEEFDNLESIKVGDDIEVFIDSIEDKEGSLLLSKRKAEFTRTWENINNLYMSGEMVEAEIVRRIKGGMVVDLFGIEAFLPGSQIDVHPVRDFDALVGVTMDFRIIKVNNQRKNVVLSHKVLVEESLQEIRTKVLGELEEGQVVEGIVKNITDFGVFVDLGGVDGLLHITDLSWGRVSHPSDIVALDEKIKVKVLRFDQEKMRISLGLKQLHEHHWENIEDRFPLETKVKGKVVSIVKYGVFVELEEGVEGLVHISEMSWTQHVRHPSQIVNVSDEVDVVVLSIDAENRKISLGMKQVEEDPWLVLEEKFKPDTRHSGIVRDLVPFGAFVELEPGIDGLIHISDLSWVRKVRHPGEVVKKGQEIEVVILSFDRNERRIALGLKQLEADPWDNFEREYPIRSRSEGSVIRVLEKGVVIMLPLGVEGFIPNSQLGRSLSGENKKNIQEGDNLSLEVIEFDKINHRIVLSHSIIERQKDKGGRGGYKETVDEVKPTMGDLMHGAGAEELASQVQSDTPKSEDKGVVEEESVTSEPAIAEAEETKEDAPKETDKPEAVETAEVEVAKGEPVDEKADTDDEVKEEKPKPNKRSIKKTAKKKAEEGTEESDDNEAKGGEAEPETVEESTVEDKPKDE